MRARPLLASAGQRLHASLGHLSRQRHQQPTLIIYTAIFGDRDTLLEPTVLTPGARYICFTDAPLHSDVWEIVSVAVEDGDPCRTARRYKLLPHRLFQTEYSLWVDGSFRVSVNVRALVDHLLGEIDLATFIHPDRDCTYQEAVACIGYGMDDPARINAQVAAYRAAGLPEHAGLSATGALLRRHTRAIERLNEVWWQELQRGSVRDQISFRYCTWRLGLQTAAIAGDYTQSSELEFLGHRVIPT